MAPFPSGPVTGGCLCAAVRLRASEPPSWSSYCHCRDCRKASGAPLVVFVGFRSEAVAFEGKSAPSTYASSPRVRRFFCRRCGSPLAYEDARLPGMLYVLIGALDHPERFPPSHHAWSAQRLPWLALDDDLPRHPGFSAQRVKPGNDGSAGQTSESNH